jgi:prepilin-type N-terminal cleavage/methylation domain-containing protein
MTALVRRSRAAAHAIARKRTDGFTLAELAVVLVIVALLVGSLLVPLSAQMDLRNAADTRRALAEIREALLGYAAVNGRLPCPAPATIASGVAGAGLEGGWTALGCPNQNQAGVVPWATLGVPETDAWGRRYSYRVSPSFSRISPTININECTAPRPPPPQNAAFALCSPGDMNVLATGGGAQIAVRVPAVVVSHGKNGNGAYTVLGTQTPAGADADEVGNQLINGGLDAASLNFVYKRPTPGFDDEVVWIPPGVLFGRMIRAGRLP